MAIHDALTLYGLTYSTDPVATLNSDNKTVDYIQFPQQTLDYKGGKCSDFSVLYSSMLEAIGVETAFITIPGHIYMAVALQMSPDDARRTFQNSDDLIYQDNKVWLPIEITLREGGFLKAWQLGAKEWRENQAKNQAQASIPSMTRGTVYQPVGYSSDESEHRDPRPGQGGQELLQGSRPRSSAWRSAQQEAGLLAASKKERNKSKPLNSLAVLYSRYGMYDKAQKVAQRRSWQGRVRARARQHRETSISCSGRWTRRWSITTGPTRRTRTTQLCFSAWHAQTTRLENYAIAKKAYAQLQQVDPDLAQKFAYLDLRGEEATRAADQAGLRKVVVWEDSSK